MITSLIDIFVDIIAAMKKFCLSIFIVAAVVVLPAQGKRFITEKDLLKFTWIADPQISPDGSAVAFVRVTVNEKENRYESSLFTVPANGGNSWRMVAGGRTFVSDDA